MMRKTILSVVGMCLGATGIAQAQEAMLTPPKVLVITREVVKPGKGPAHEKWETGWPRAFAKAKWPVRWLAVTSMTGESRALYMTGYESLAAWESDREAVDKSTALSAENEALGVKDGEFLSETRTGVFRYMPELSYQADVPAAGMRYFQIASIHVKPGHGDHFTEIRKIVRAAHEKAGLSDHYSVYHMVAGGPTTHYLIFIPIKSLAEADQFPVIQGKAYEDALGEEGRKKVAEFRTQGLESSETHLFAFSPKMSYPPKAWVDGEPGFWAPKPAPMAKPAAKKEAAKP
jgi:hypothetical protein